MDSFTKETKDWLETRFKKTTTEGIYYSHQSIYGFRDNNCDAYAIQKYIITYQIMKALSLFDFNTLIDIGGAEGYKAALAKRLFECKVKSCDLSEEACKRANEIYNIEGESVDVHNIPYSDNEFDIVLCSETLEHVSNLEKATKELLRIAKKAVIITVPYEPLDTINKNIEEKIPHAHIHALDENTFNFIKPFINKMIIKKALFTILNLPSAIFEGRKKEYDKSSYSSLAVKLYNALTPIFRFIFNEKAASLLIKMDDLLSKTKLPHAGYLFILIKDQNSLLKKPKKIFIKDITGFTVPHHYICP